MNTWQRVTFGIVLVLVAFSNAGDAKKTKKRKTRSTAELPLLEGEWKEDQYKRDNLNNFLYEMGVNWFKRTFATTSPWENEQNIQFLNNAFHVDGKNGPLAKPYTFDLYPDGTTFSVVDLGSDLGGLTDATAEIKGNSLVTSLRMEGQKDVFMLATRTVNTDEPDVMIFETKHLPSGVAMTSWYNRVVEVKSEEE